MKYKFGFLFLFLIITTSVYGQKLEDIFDMGNSNSTNGTTTLSVDKELAKGNTPEEKARQDSIKQLYNKWYKYFNEKNNAMQLLFSSIQQLDTNKVTKEDVKNYKRQIEDCKEEVNDYINNNNDNSWKNFDELVEMNGLFNKTYRNAAAVLEDMGEKGNKKPVNKWLVLGGSLLALMVLFPIISQIKSGITMKKTKLEQQKQMKRQQEEMERQMLLSNDNNIITLKE